MSKNAIITLLAETPLHPGTGQNVGVIDLPVQRERHTKFPYIPSSSLKGALRSALQIDDKSKRAIFGADLESGSHFAGAVSFSDTKILAFPVRTLHGVFGWVTSPVVIDRLRRDLSLVGSGIDIETLPEFDASKVLTTTSYAGSKRAVIEDLVYEGTKDARVDTLAKIMASLCLNRASQKMLHDKLTRDLMILTEARFRHHVEYGAEVRTRNKLSDEKTSENLWSMELIPRDTLFYSLVMAEDSRSDDTLSADNLLSLLVTELSQGYIQVGGNETLGHGWSATSIHSVESLRDILDATR